MTATESLRTEKPQPQIVPKVKPAFDAGLSFEMSIESGAEVKTCKLRYPTDAEWAKCSNAQATRIDNLGRGKTKTTNVNSVEARADLFAVIRQDEGAEFDEIEASTAIARLDDTEVTESEILGDRVVVRLKIPIVWHGQIASLITAHELKKPTLKQRHSFVESTFSSTGDARGVIEKRHLEPGGALYKDLLIEVRGYKDNAVPLPHRFAVVHEVLRLTNPKLSEAAGESAPLEA